MARHTAIILGAGFSRPAGGPLLKELLNPDWYDQGRLSEQQQLELDALNQRLVQASTGTVERIFTEAWTAARTGGRISTVLGTLDGNRILSTLQFHLATVASKVRLRRGTKLWEGYKQFFLSNYDRSKSLTVITFNYDLLAEQILDDANFYFDTGGNSDFRLLDPRRRRGLTRHGSELPLLKLHGSVGWGVCRGCRTSEYSGDSVSVFEDPYAPVRRQLCPFCYRNMLEIGVVPPIQGKAGEIRHMTSLWSRARKLVTRATEVIIIGYSLPETDVEARSLLRDAAESGNLRKTTVVNGPGGASETLRELFPDLIDRQVYFETYIGEA